MDELIVIDLDDLIHKWENSALELREAESLITGLIAHGRRTEKELMKIDNSLSLMVSGGAFKDNALDRKMIVGIRGKIGELIDH